MCFYYSCKSFKLQLRLFLTPFWSLFWMQSEIFKGAKRWFLKVKKKCQQQSTNHSIIHASQGLKKKNLTQVFSVASFLYSPFFFKVLRKFHCVVIFIKKSSEIFFSLWGKKLPCELILNSFSRTLSEFWHWFVANIPGQSVDDGDTLFEHLFPLVLPEGDGDHRYFYLHAFLRARFSTRTLYNVHIVIHTILARKIFTAHAF